MFRFLLFCLALTLTVGCSTPAASGTATSTDLSPAAPPSSYAGTWDLSVQNTPAGNITGTLTLTETADGLSGTLSAGGTTTELGSVTQTDTGLSISFYSTDYQTDVTMRLDGAADADTLEGRTLGEYPTTATRN